MCFFFVRVCTCLRKRKLIFFVYCENNIDSIVSFYYFSWSQPVFEDKYRFRANVLDYVYDIDMNAYKHEPTIAWKWWTTNSFQKIMIEYLHLTKFTIFITMLNSTIKYMDTIVVPNGIWKIVEDFLRSPKTKHDILKLFSSTHYMNLNRKIFIILKQRIIACLAYIHLFGNNAFDCNWKSNRNNRTAIEFFWYISIW